MAKNAGTNGQMNETKRRIRTTNLRAISRLSVYPKSAFCHQKKSENVIKFFKKTTFSFEKLAPKTVFSFVNFQKISETESFND